MCDAELTAPHLRAEPVCASQICRHRYTGLPKGSLCGHCRRPLAWASRSRGYCDDPACRRSFLHEGRERRQAELRDLAGRRRGVRDPETYQLLDLPSQRGAITRLPARRRAQFRAHLEVLVERARRTQSDPTYEAGPLDDNVWPRTPPPPVAAVTQRAVVRGCTLCKGYCCISGAPHAWLDTPTMRRQIEADPKRSTGEIVEAYMGAIRSRTYRDSCVYHGPAGCSLAPDMRSDICNNYFCKPMLQFRADSAAVDTLKVFVVVRDGRRRERGIFVAEGGETPTPQ